VTKPVLNGKVAQQVYALIADEAREGKREALDGLYLMLGDDAKAAIENQRTIIDRLEQIERVMSKMSQLKITAAYKLLTDKTGDNNNG
jgi:hypothetical protein